MHIEGNTTAAITQGDISNILEAALTNNPMRSAAPETSVENWLGRGEKLDSLPSLTKKNPGRTNKTIPT